MKSILTPALCAVLAACGGGAGDAPESILICPVSLQCAASGAAYVAEYRVVGTDTLAVYGSADLGAVQAQVRAELARDTLTLTRVAR
jgi:hypothetical protein